MSIYDSNEDQIHWEELIKQQDEQLSNMTPQERQERIKQLEIVADKLVKIIKEWKV